MSRKVVSKNPRADLAFELEKEIRFRKSDIGQGIWAIAKSLKEIHDKQLYIELGYQNLSEWVSSPDIDLAPRWAYAFIDLYETYILEHKMSLKDTDFISTDYTKLYQILPIIKKNPKKAKDWISKAIHLRRIDLHREIAEFKVKERTKLLTDSPSYDSKSTITTLKHANPLQELPRIPSNSVQAVITVPPQLKRSEMQLMVSAQPGVSEVAIFHQARVQYHERWLKEAVRIITEKGNIYTVVDKHNMPSVLTAMKQLGLFTSHIVWEHSPFTPPVVGVLAQAHHMVLCGSKIQNSEENLTDIKLDVWKIDFKAEYEVEGDIPPSLATELITLSTLQGETIVDPFASAGTIISMARRLGRNAMGMEAGSEAYGIANARLTAEETPHTLKVANV